MNPYGYSQLSPSQEIARNLALAQGEAMMTRAAQTNQRERAKTAAANSGESPLARPPAWERSYPQLDAFNPRPNGPQNPRIVGNPVANPNASVNSPEIQSALDAVPGTQQPSSVAATGRTMMTPYGMISSNAAPAGSAQLTAAETAAATTPTGINHAQTQPQDDRQHFKTQDEANVAGAALRQSHPEIFQNGTAANQAFVAYAKEHGQAAAFQNADNIVRGGPSLNPTANNANTAIPSGGIPTPPATPTAQTNQPRPAAEPTFTPYGVPTGAGIHNFMQGVSNLFAYGNGTQPSQPSQPLQSAGPTPGLWAAQPGQGKEFAHAMGLGQPGVDTDWGALKAMQIAQAVNQPKQPEQERQSPSLAAY